MPQGRDMPKADTRYLYKRNGRPTWWIKIRVPGTDGTFRQSLKTKDLREAQARRDKLLAQREQLVRMFLTVLGHNSRRCRYWQFVG